MSSNLPPSGPAIPYLQKNIVERTLITRTSSQQIQTALEYLAQFGPPPSGPVFPSEPWVPPRSF